MKISKYFVTMIIFPLFCVLMIPIEQFLGYSDFLYSNMFVFRNFMYDLFGTYLLPFYALSGFFINIFIIIISISKIRIKKIRFIEFILILLANIFAWLYVTNYVGLQ